MSDKRATYAIGAVAATLALVLGLITAVPATTVNTYSTGLNMLGHAEVVLKDADGNIKAYQQSDNVIPINGQDCSADLLFGDFDDGLCNSGAGTAAKWLFIGVGSDGVTTATDVDTDLGTELSISRTGTLIAEDAATEGASGTGAMKTVRGTFVLTSSATVAEVGLFDDFPDGEGGDSDMFSRIVLGTPISAGPGDTVTITYKVTVG